MRSRIPTGFLAVLVAFSVLAPVAYSQPRTTEPGEDFPLEDHSVWLFVERGLKNQAADPDNRSSAAVELGRALRGDARN
jgi:hypothetical protein